MGIISQIFEIGVAEQAGKSARTIRIINIISAIACVSCSFYIVCYFFLDSWISVIINCAVLVLYALTLAWNHKQRYRIARNWIFCVFLFHLAILTLFEFSKDTGFHFYYFIVPASSFLLYEYEDRATKFILSSVGFIMFLVSELWTSHSPYVEFSPDAYRFFYTSSVMIVFLILLIIVISFTSSIHHYEKKREGLIDELHKTLSEVKTLKGFIPICSVCKKIRDDKGYWNQIESYLRDHSDVQFSHGTCPECIDKLYRDEDWYIERKGQKTKDRS